MSFYQGRRLLPQRFRLVLLSAMQVSGLPFSDVLTEEEIEDAFDEQESWFAQEDGDVFTPPVTLWGFLSQVLHKEELRSCLAAVSRVSVLMVALGREPCAQNNGAYCKARAKLPEIVIERLATRMADRCEQKVPDDWLWKGRHHVKMADGTTVSMPDTPENQEGYRVKRLDKRSCLVEWPRPDKPDWMDEETYNQMPESITLRQIEVKVEEPGCRVKSFVVVTTLTDTKEYSNDDIAQLYHKRWHVELDIRAIKCTLGMDVMRCKTPEMVRKEIWTCLLAYNLIRRTMLQAAKKTGLSPRQLSFTNALQNMAASWVILPTLDKPTMTSMINTQIESLASQLVGKPTRANRVEPRAVKRRPKPHRLLTMPREEARELLRSGVDLYGKQN